METASTMHMVFASRKPENYRDVIAADTKKLLTVHERLLHDGIFLDPCLTVLIRAAHTEEDLEVTLTPLIARYRPCSEVSTLRAGGDVISTAVLTHLLPPSGIACACLVI